MELRTSISNLQEIITRFESGRCDATQASCFIKREIEKLPRSTEITHIIGNSQPAEVIEFAREMCAGLSKAAERAKVGPTVVATEESATFYVENLTAEEADKLERLECRMREVAAGLLAAVNEKRKPSTVRRVSYSFSREKLRALEKLNIS